MSMKLRFETVENYIQFNQFAYEKFMLFSLNSERNEVFNVDIQWNMTIIIL